MITHVYVSTRARASSATAGACAVMGVVAPLSLQRFEKRGERRSK
ncbi:hypothetical protein AKJ09_09496 [Labilithrix luteola]|uniref:Uncharacterized protein n=1 Tax=Labilithrix luteola TaxID=1391654 RepID=A0A0K1QAS4_9BACT|nr:hypothetical protein AKJ09_09496 [Labilithrix luteola]